MDAVRCGPDDIQRAEVGDHVVTAPDLIPCEYAVDFGTGQYHVAVGNLPVTASSDDASEQVAVLHVGEVVRVVEVSDRNVHCTRGRIVSPIGWITLKSMDSQEFMVTQCNPTVVSIGPDPRCGSPTPLRAMATVADRLDSPRPSGDVALLLSAEPALLPEEVEEPHMVAIDDVISEQGLNDKDVDAYPGCSGEVHLVTIDEVISEQGPTEEEMSEGTRAIEHFGILDIDQDSELIRQTDLILKIVFWHEGENIPCVFTKKPLGLRWRMKSPLKIDEVLSGSHAQECGVQKGWQVRMINDVDVSGKSYRDVVKVFQEGLEVLPWIRPCGATKIEKRAWRPWFNWGKKPN